MSSSACAIAFAGSRRIARGSLLDVALAAKAVFDGGETAPILAFDALTGHPIEVDFWATADQVRARLSSLPAEVERGRGRPKLGVTSREVTLLPRHWDWLAAQRGGASAALRRLVDEARRGSEAADAMRLGREAVYRFITAMAGNEPGYEDATRALFAGNEATFAALTEPWPTDVRAQALALARPAFGHAPSPLDDLVPPERRAAVERALAAAFPNAVVEGAERMAWGASGAGVFKLTAGGAPCVLRLEGPPDGFRDPARHYACLRIAADAGVAPSMLHADAAAGVSLVAFVGAASANTTLLRARALEAVVGVVKRLHAAPLFPRLVPYLDALDGVMGGLRQSGVASVETLVPVLSLYGRLTGAYPRNDPHLVSSHNDLNPSNVIFQGERPFIVDWEAAFAADPYADIAALANWFAADQASEALILNTYFGKTPGEDQFSRFLVMRQINRLFYGAMLIGAAKAERPETNVTSEDLSRERFDQIRNQMRTLGTCEGRLRFGCAFLAQALHDAATPRFADALARLEQA